jgi:hypothetical protein
MREDAGAAGPGGAAVLTPHTTQAGATRGIWHVWLNKTPIGASLLLWCSSSDRERSTPHSVLSRTASRSRCLSSLPPSRIGAAGTANVQGEDQKKLDILSNDIMINSLRACGRRLASQAGCSTDGLGFTGKCAVLISEENDDPIIIDTPYRGRYCVVFDPLDGRCVLVSRLASGKECLGCRLEAGGYRVVLALTGPQLQASASGLGRRQT